MRKKKKITGKGYRMFLKRLMGALWRHKILYLLIICIAMACTSVQQYEKKISIARGTLTLNYEEAAKGLYPNSTRFSISLIKSKEVLDRVIEWAGLNGITAEDLADNITATGNSAPGNLGGSSESSYRIATSYSITYQKNENISGISAKDILNLIFQAYKEEFYEKYTFSGTSLKWSPDEETLDDMEYLEAYEEYQKTGKKLQRFLNKKIQENGTYKASSTNETFVSLKEEVDNFLSVDLEKFYSYLTRSGIARDKESYAAKLQYQNQLLDQNYQKFSEDYQIRMDAIQLYDSALTAVVLVPTVDTTDEFYMSRTKVGIDYLAEEAKAVDGNANDTQENIQKNKYVISQISNVEPDQSNLEQADSMSSSLKEVLKNLSEKISDTNQEYMTYKTKNYLTISGQELTMQDLLSVKRMIVTGAGVLMLICIFNVIWIAKIDKKVCLFG